MTIPSTQMRVADWIADRLYKIGVRNIYGLMGGGAAGLNDGFIKHGGLRYICFHHEQGAGHAATAEAKLTGNLAVVNPTTGCGGTNCITSVLNAWQDGVPVLFISGNVRSDHCSSVINDRRGTRIRKFGIQEHNIIETVRSMTKYAAFVESQHHILEEMENAINAALDGRPGPVWLDIPSDVQSAPMPKAIWEGSEFIADDGYPLMPDLVLDRSVKKNHPIYIENMYAKEIIGELETAERPVILAGQGIKQSKTLNDFKWFIETFKVPYVSTYGARDLLPYDHPLNIGAVGIKGSRAGNFAMQACDKVLVLGCSVNVSHIGYDPTMWTPLATAKMIVDIDDEEIRKGVIHWTIAATGDLRKFFLAARSIHDAA